MRVQEEDRGCLLSCKYWHEVKAVGGHTARLGIRANTRHTRGDDKELLSYFRSRYVCVLLWIRA